MERWQFERSSRPLSYPTKMILFCVKMDKEMRGYCRVGFSRGSQLGGGLTLEETAPCAGMSGYSTICVLDILRKKLALQGIIKTLKE